MAVMTRTCIIISDVHDILYSWSLDGAATATAASWRSRSRGGTGKANGKTGETFTYQVKVLQAQMTNRKPVDKDLKCAIRSPLFTQRYVNVLECPTFLRYLIFS